MQVPQKKNNMLNTRTPNTSQAVTFNLALRHEHHSIKFARPISNVVESKFSTSLFSSVWIFDRVL